MGAVNKKLHKQRGSTLVFAVFFLLLCAVFSVSILSAASADVNAAAKRMDNAQDRLILNSAAGLFLDMMEGRTYTYYDYSDPYLDIENCGHFVEPSAKDPEGAITGGLLSELIIDKLNALCKGETPAKSTVTISLPEPHEQYMLAELAVGEDFSIQLTLWFLTEKTNEEEMPDAVLKSVPYVKDGGKPRLRLTYQAKNVDEGTAYLPDPILHPPAPPDDDNDDEDPEDPTEICPNVGQYAWVVINTKTVTWHDEPVVTEYVTKEGAA